MKKTLQTLVLIFTSLLLFQCANNKNNNSKESTEIQPQSNTTAMNEKDLNGLWILQSTTKPQFEIKKGTSLKISNGQFNLNAMCNIISGPFEVNNSTLTFNKEKVISTLKGCFDGYEDQFKNLLFDVTQFELNGANLTLKTKDNIQLVWKKQDALSHLLEKEWAVVSATENGLEFSDENPKLTMTFNKEGKIFGFSGCNNFNGNYRIEGENIIIEKVAMTRMACMPKEMEIESNFMKNINKSNFTIEDSSTQITLRDQSGSIVFMLE